MTEKSLKTVRESVCKFIKMTVFFTLKEQVASFSILPILLFEIHSQIALVPFTKNGILLFMTATVVINATVGARKPASGKTEVSLTRRI